MGIVRMGPPEELVLLLKRNQNVSTFIETGTFKGGTAAWASNYFEKVITIENSRIYHAEAANSHKHLPNVEFLFGDSRTVLANILATLHEPAIFWLDAHWCSMDSAGADDQCPIIEEMNIIHSAGIAPFIFIDDARLFLSPPPLPNRMEQWPTIDQICTSVRSSNETDTVFVFEDVIIDVPQSARAIVSEYCQAANTKAWAEHGKRVAPRGLDLIQQGVRLLAENAGRKLKRVLRS